MRIDMIFWFLRAKQTCSITLEAARCGRRLQQLLGRLCLVRCVPRKAPCFVTVVRVKLDVHIC